MEPVVGHVEGIAWFLENESARQLNSRHRANFRANYANVLELLLLTGRGVPSHGASYPSEFECKDIDFFLNGEYV